MIFLLTFLLHYYLRPLLLVYIGVSWCTPVDAISRKAFNVFGDTYSPEMLNARAKRQIEKKLAEHEKAETSGC